MSSLSTEGLPAGRFHGVEGASPAYWVSDESVEADVWEAAVAARPHTGWSPVFVPENGPEDPSFEVSTELSLEERDAAVVLSDLWNDGVLYDGEVDPELAELTAPFGGRWPGLAASLPFREDPDELLRGHVGVMAGEESRLLLAPVARNADFPAAVDWTGPVNHVDDPDAISVVLRSWEDRFGTRILRIGFDTLELTVAGVPMTTEQALSVAAEHYAFCPDSIDQGYTDTETLAEYAETLIGQDRWRFWWD